MTSVKEELTATVNVDHLLSILTERMYRDPSACVREYVSNAHDACLGQSDPQIEVRSDGPCLVFSDNGRGMTRDDLIHGFVAIAGHRVNTAQQRKTVGMFGLGVLSGFMVADRIEVETRSETDSTGWRLEW